MARLFEVVAEVTMTVLADNLDDAYHKVEKYLQERIRRSCHGKPTTVGMSSVDELETDYICVAPNMVLEKCEHTQRPRAECANSKCKYAVRPDED